VFLQFCEINRFIIIAKKEENSGDWYRVFYTIEEIEVLIDKQKQDMGGNDVS
jgi:hypothetical protein